ncbi:hypothetical protein CI610_02944 [invertebrate metagenome]|uniref:Reverse transcriptase domain-containing protein n=1 Tax=invertebrate metagenome TaxID=1711999 RepID=A0A2H9T4I5_9ZZZZ
MKFFKNIDILESLYDVYSDKGKVFIIGDFNVKVRGDRYQFTDNNRSRLFQQFLDKTNMISLNVQSECTGPICTFYPETDNSTAIDHVLIESNSIDLTMYCKVLDDDGNVSEHCPIVCSVGVPKSFTGNTSRCNKYKWKKALSDGSICNYQCYVKRLLDCITVPTGNPSGHDIDCYYNNICSALLEAADKCIPKTMYKKYQKPYWDESLTVLHNEMLHKRYLWIQSGKRRQDCRTFSEYKKYKTKFRRQLRKSFESYMKNQFAEIDRSGDLDQNLFWQLFKSKKSASRAKQTELKYEGKVFRDPHDIINGWRLHFQHIFKNHDDKEFDCHFRDEMEKRIKMLKSSIHSDENLFLRDNFTFSEINLICKNLKSGKAGGHEGLVYEHIKYAGHSVINHIQNLFNLVVKHEYIPKSWKHGIIVTMYKGHRKPKDDPNSYRGITLLPVFFKMFEVAIAKRISYVIESDVFPNKQQSAYQKNLCSLCTAFNLQECIYYNMENGSDVYVSFLDSSKAFDTVWHDGLLAKLYDIGLTGKVWNILKFMYTDINSSVFFNGLISAPGKMERGILQGGALSAKMYLIFINDLLDEVERCGRGAMIIDKTVNIPTQADDTCLVSTNITSLNKMLTICESYSRKWRFLYSASKSKVVVFSNKRTITINCTLRLYDNILPVVSEITHVGILLNDKHNSIERTKQACTKLKSGTMALLRSGVHQCALNPLTIAKILKIKVYPSALYGCELWVLSNTELLMLERAQHFIVKSIQGFGKRTRTDMCTSLIGWLSIEAYIDIKKLLYLGRICRMNRNNLICRVFISRFFMYIVNNCSQKGFIPDIVRILKKYNLYEYIVLFLDDGSFPNKIHWKSLIYKSVSNYETNAWLHRMSNDADFTRFLLLHDDLKPHYLWQLALRHPNFLYNIGYIMKLIVTVRVSNVQLLCHHCGLFYTDFVTHVILQCSVTDNIRDNLWCIIASISSIELSTYLHSLPDYSLIHILLGGPMNHQVNESDHEEFRLESIYAIKRMFDLYT